MKVNKNLNYKKLAIISIILIFIILIALFFSIFSKYKSLKLNDFEKISIYNYLENDILNVEKLYQLSGKTNYDELQLFQSKLKQALDLYFLEHSESEVSTSTILNLIDAIYVPESIDFHGIIVSDYEYNPEEDVFVKSIGANANISGIESDINNINYSDKKASVQKIEKTSDNKYKVTFNIISTTIENDSFIASGEVILSIKDNNLNIDSCSLAN